MLMKLFVNLIVLVKRIKSIKWGDSKSMINEMSRIRIFIVSIKKE